MTGSSGAIIEIPPGVFPQGSEYLYTVYIRDNQRNAKSSQKINVKNFPSPILNCNDKNSEKVNPFERYILNCSVIAPSGIVNGSWSSPDLDTVDFQKISIIPLSFQLLPGTSLIQLGIFSNSLTNRLSYSFRLNAFYTDNAASLASVSITIQINSPPLGGDFNVVPSTGTALSTVYLFTTNDWVDDADDLPLRYFYFYFVELEDNQMTLKSLNYIPSTRAVLGQGLKSKGYMVTSGLKVFDRLGSFSTSYKIITVLPIANLNFTSIENQLDMAYQVGNLDTSFQLLSAVGASINTVNCDSLQSTTCSLFNRRPCSTVTNTCGECLPGFIGMIGHSNTACLKTTNILSLKSSKILQKEYQETFSPPSSSYNMLSTQDPANSIGIGGALCKKDNTCFSGKCDFGVCAEAYKSCPNKCSNKGRCENWKGPYLLSTPCNITDNSCTPVCICSSGFYGIDCSFDYKTFVEKQRSRETICKNLLTLAVSQHVTLDSLVSRVNLFTSLFTDKTQITDTTISYCALAFIETAKNEMKLVGKLSTIYYPLFAIWSNILSSSNLPIDVAHELKGTLSLITTSITSNLAIGEASVEFVSPDIRITVSLVGQNTPINSLVLPQNDLEKMYDYPVSYLNLNASFIMNSNIGISLSQFNFSRPYNASDINLQIQTFNSASSTTAEFTTLTNLQNSHDIYYDPIHDPPRILSCYPSESAYVIPFNCSGIFHNFTCPGYLGGYYYYHCPGSLSYAMCSSDSYLK
jgi:hypothetical protein